MKKLVALLLVVAILVSCFSVAYATESKEELNFAVASDLHIVPPAEELERTNDDPIFWYANRRAAMDEESGFILDSFLEQCADDDSVEFVLISGDISNDGRFRGNEHTYAAEKLKAFEEKTGKQVYVINGNHDLGVGGAPNIDFSIDDFKRVYATLGYDQALSVRDDDCSYTVNLGEKYRLIALDSCDPSRSSGDGMTDDKINWVLDEAAKAQSDGRYPILMMHHNLLDHMPIQSVLSKDFIIKNHLSTAEKFANAGIKLVFTGHEHCSDATSYTSTSGNVIYDFATTALSMYPLEYRVFSLTDNEIKYEAKEVEKIDTEALSAITKGYTPEILAAMDADLNEFARGYLKTGVEYRLALSLSEEKLGLDKDAFYFEFVMKVVTRLTDLLKMPFYGEGGLQELAKQYNLEIPDSKYVNGWDLATDIVAYHYSGNEPFELESDEVKILLRTVALILREEFYLIKDELFLSAAEDVLGFFGVSDADKLVEEFGKKGYDKITAIEYFLLAVASPILYEFSLETDDVDDNNGILPGYGTVNDDTKLENVGKHLSVIFEKIVLYVSMIIKYFSKMFI